MFEFSLNIYFPLQWCCSELNTTTFQPKIHIIKTLVYHLNVHGFYEYGYVNKHLSNFCYLSLIYEIVFFIIVVTSYIKISNSNKHVKQHFFLMQHNRCPSSFNRVPSSLHVDYSPRSSGHRSHHLHLKTPFIQ